MNISSALRLVGVIAAWAGLLGSLFLLYLEPLFGVLGILCAMALLLASLARPEESGRSTIDQGR